VFFTVVVRATKLRSAANGRRNLWKKMGSKRQPGRDNRSREQSGPRNRQGERSVDSALETVDSGGIVLKLCGT
jgi:hypothetical protein